MKTFGKVIVGSVVCAALLLVVRTSSADRSLLIRVGEDEGRNGVCKKVVMTPKRGEEAVYTSEPGGGGTVTKVEPFAFFWQLREEDGSIPNGDYYRIGSAVGEPHGYVQKDAVTEWNTLNCLVPFPPSANEVFRTDLPSGDYVEYRGTTASENVRCFILNSDVEDKGIEAEDVPYDVVLYMGEEHEAQETTATREGKKDIDVTKIPLEVVFVIDTTASMEPLIAVAKEVARLTTGKLQGSSEKPNVRLGLVQYRDAKGESGQHCDFDAQLGCQLTKTYGEFTSSLDSLQAAAMGSGDWQEAVGIGLEMALDDEQMGWSPRASKQIVLLGDAANKKDHGPSISEIIERCKAPGAAGGEQTMRDVQIHAIVNGDDDEAISEFQMITTSTGRSAFYKHVPTDNENDPSVEAAAGELAGYLNNAIQASSALNSNDPKQLTKIAIANPDNAIVQDMFAIRASNGDPKTTEQLFQKGVASVKGVKGGNVAEKRVLVLRNTLKRLGANLSAIALNLEDTDRDQRKDANVILENVQSVLAKQLSGDQQTLRGTALIDVIGSDLPIQTKSLQYTAESLANMTNDDFQKWISEIKDAADTANSLVEDKGMWLDNGVDVGGKQNDSHFTFLAIHRLP